MLPDTFDFGYSSDDIIIESVDIDYKDRLIKIEQLILPLLNNLLLNSDVPLINWPNRRPVIEQKIDELLQLTRT
jgi:hypothetical protein